VHAGPGVAVIDDTYNANPIGARAALDEAAALAAERSAPLVVVTPGIVELGPVQAERNADFAEAAARAGAHLVVVGRTNRAALVAGARRAGGTLDVVDRREQGVTLATSVAGERGVVLYENDLPDHYP
jgi:UDP-N-acetylmuramoyl-tripeptide--D-alanyl-D-alanine ligase